MQTHVYTWLPPTSLMMTFMFCAFIFYQKDCSRKFGSQNWRSHFTSQIIRNGFSALKLLVICGTFSTMERLEILWSPTFHIRPTGIPLHALVEKASQRMMRFFNETPFKKEFPTLHEITVDIEALGSYERYEQFFDVNASLQMKLSE